MLQGISISNIEAIEKTRKLQWRNTETLKKQIEILKPQSTCQHTEIRVCLQQQNGKGKAKPQGFSDCVTEVTHQSSTQKRDWTCGTVSKDIGFVSSDPGKEWKQGCGWEIVQGIMHTAF